MSEVANESETEVISAPPDAKKRLDPGFKRNLKIILGFLVVVVLVLLVFILMGSGAGSEKAQRSGLEVGGGNVVKAGPMSPALEDMVKEQQQIEATHAARAGKSYIPPDPTGHVEPVEVAAAPGSVSSYENSAIPAATSMPVSERDTRRREGLERQLRNLLDAGDGENMTRARVSADKNTGGSTATAAAGGTATSAGANVNASRVVVPGLEIVAGELVSQMNIPAGRSVDALAMVRSGPLNGALLMGKGQVVDEAIAINFTRMRLGASTYEIDAIVLDPATATSAISGTVDRRLLQRYVLPVTLAVAQGYFGAKASVGSVAINVGNEGAVATPAPSAEQARAAGVEEGFKIAGQTVQRAAAAPIVVSTERGTSVGILFRAPVTEEIK